MGLTSIYCVRFSMTNPAGKTVAGPWTTNIGLSGGSRSDVHSTSVTSSLVTAITSNLLAILQAEGFAGTSAPGGTVAIDSYDHASTPDAWS